MAIEVIKNSPVVARITEADEEYYYTAELSLPYGSIHNIGFTFDSSRSVDVVTTSRLEVPKEFRGNGIAARLLKAGFALAKSKGITVSMSHVSSPYALMARRSIFGDENMTICDDDPYATPLGITIDSAVEALENEEREHGYVVISSLAELNTWEWNPVLIDKE